MAIIRLLGHLYGCQFAPLKAALQRFQPHSGPRLDDC